MTKNKHECRCDWNHNSEIYVSYNGNEYDDFCKYNDLDDFGDLEYMEYKINQELNSQFNSHKQSILKKMLVYI